MSYAIRYAVALLVMIVGDALWLSYFARAMFRPTLGTMLLDDPRWLAAALFYLLYAAGIVWFAVTPALRSGSWSSAALSGALVGFLAYMTYDLTNLATIKAWTVQLALVDMAWGTLLTAIAATASYFAAARLA
ncbi:MAG TPA: DUF2177 family protein [Rhizomicrobium sp.]|nr:DUF2177 family protein [Rhizomicrobium sp.]